VNRKLLVVDDEETIRWALQELFMQDGWQVCCTEDGDAAARLLEQESYDYMITDLKMYGRSAMSVIGDALERNPRMGVTILTGYASLETAMESIRLRVWDYLTKPCNVAAMKSRVDEFFQDCASRGGERPCAQGLNLEDLNGFLEGAGTELLACKPIPSGASSEGLLHSLKRTYQDVGISPERADELVQVAVETIARLPREGGACRAGLLKGHVVVSFTAPIEVAESWSHVTEKLGTQFGADARFVQRDSQCSLLLGEPFSR